MSLDNDAARTYQAMKHSYVYGYAADSRRTTLRLARDFMMRIQWGAKLPRSFNLAYLRMIVETPKVTERPPHTGITCVCGKQMELSQSRCDDCIEYLNYADQMESVTYGRGWDSHNTED